jgi:hypothetical protein
MQPASQSAGNSSSSCKEYCCDSRHPMQTRQKGTKSNKGMLLDQHQLCCHTSTAAVLCTSWQQRHLQDSSISALHALHNV